MQILLNPFNLQRNSCTYSRTKQFFKCTFTKITMGIASLNLMVLSLGYNLVGFLPYGFQCLYYKYMNVSAKRISH